MHQVMRELVPRPEPFLCQLCFEVPPYHLANTDGRHYDYDPKHWFWCCVYCHIPYDLRNGSRRRALLSGDLNPFFGRKHTPETRQKMKENHANFSGSNNPNFGVHRLGALNPMFGKKQTEETKMKIRESKLRNKRPCRKGDKHPMFGRTDDKSPMFGRHHTPDSKLKSILAKAAKKWAKSIMMSGRFRTISIG
jgi:hypothetical protein